MKGNAVKFLFILLIGLIPSVVLAQGIFDVQPTDKSMQYLGMIFGNVGDLPIQPPGGNRAGGANAAVVNVGNFSEIVYQFNIIIFILGIIIVAYTTFAGVIATAQEGEVLGKKWSSIIIPIRAAAGVYLLIPSGATHYNWIQVIVMWFIVQGVGAANSLWSQVLISNQTDGSIHEGIATPSGSAANQATSASTAGVALQNGMPTIMALFKSVVCMQMLNQKAEENKEIERELKTPVIMERIGDTMKFYRPGFDTTPICGSLSLPALGDSVFTPSNSSDVVLRQNMLETAVEAAVAYLDYSAQEAVTGTTPWAYAENFLDANRTLSDGVKDLASTFQSTNAVFREATTNGWIHAGSYYFQIVSATASRSISFQTIDINPNNIFSTLFGGQAGSVMLTEINRLVTSYQTYVWNQVKTQNAAPTTTGSSMAYNRVTSNRSDIQNVLDEIFGSFFIDLAADIGKSITTDRGDPVVSMAKFGGDLASSIELIFWGTLIIVFIAWLITSIGSCLQPLGHALDFVLSILIPILTLVITLLWAGGITLALYVPLIPYMVFTFGAVAWIILVIEAMFGAPLIALTLIVPSEDEIGKAGHAIIILLGLFLRPALMILGFIFAAKFLMVAVGLLNFAFATTLKQSISMGFGLFGFVAVLLLYVGVATTLVHEAFSLIYILPDKVLRWMGGSPEDTGKIAQKTKEMEGSVQKGAGMGKGMMKGVLGQVSKKK